MDLVSKAAAKTFIIGRPLRLTENIALFVFEHDVSTTGFGAEAAAWIGLPLVLASLISLVFAGRRRESSTSLAVCMGLLSGSCVGNIQEMILRGGATDFIMVGTEWMFMIVNFADIMIAASALGLVTGQFLQLKRRHQSRLET